MQDDELNFNRTLNKTYYDAVQAAFVARGRELPDVAPGIIIGASEYAKNHPKECDPEVREALKHNRWSPFSDQEFQEAKRS